MSEEIKVRVELRVHTTCDVFVNPEPDEDGQFTITRIAVPTIEGFTSDMDPAALSDEEFAEVDRLAAIEVTR